MTSELNDEGLNVLDLINALGSYMAGEAGAFDNIYLSGEEAGAIGAAMTDVQDAVLNVFSGDMTLEEASDVIDVTITATAGVLVANAMKVGVEAVATVVKVKLPMLAPVIDVAKTWVQQKIPQFAARTVEIVKEYGKKFKDWLFG
jgi:hypothetical protein